MVSEFSFLHLPKTKGGYAKWTRVAKPAFCWRIPLGGLDCLSRWEAYRLPIYHDGIQCDAPRTFLMNFDERGPSGNGGSECSDDGRPETILAEEFRFSTCFGFSA